jgi:hypothetical protein
MDVLSALTSPNKLAMCINTSTMIRRYIEKGNVCTDPHIPNPDNKSKSVGSSS